MLRTGLPLLHWLTGAAFGSRARGVRPRVGGHRAGARRSLVTALVAGGVTLAGCATDRPAPDTSQAEAAVARSLARTHALRVWARG